MITIREIAKLANVSRGTVDRVLNNRPGVSEETIVKVRTIADEYGYEPNALGQMLAAKKKHLHFGFIVFDTPVDFFFHDVIKAAEEKAVELKTFGVEVTIFRLKSLKETDVKKELDMIEEERLDGIAITPLQLPSIDQFLLHMEENGIPVVFYNMKIERPSLCYVGCNYFESGRVAAGLIAMVIQEEGKILAATSFHKETRSFTDRLAGFITELTREYPHINLVNQNDVFVFQKDEYEPVLKAICDDEEIKALYIINPGDYGICEAIAKIDPSHRIKIITNDLLKEKIYLLKNKTITAVIGQEPEIQGKLPLQILFDYMCKGILPVKEHITHLSIYIKQNV